MERNWDDMFWLGPTPLKNDGVRQLGSLFPYGNIKHVPNHQPDNGCEML
jgi:hypothetical protein